MGHCRLCKHNNQCTFSDARGYCERVDMIYFWINIWVKSIEVK